MTAKTKCIMAASLGLMLFSCVLAEEEVIQEKEMTEVEGKGIMTSDTPDDHSQLLTRVIFGFLISTGCYILWSEVGNGFQLVLTKIAKYKNKGKERVDTSEHTYVPSNELFDEPSHVPSISSYSYYTYDDNYESRSLRSLRDSESFVSRIINSIDIVESAFTIMNVTDTSCRKQKMCDLQKAASNSPLVGTLLKYVRPSIRSLDSYKDAMEAGDALQDCASLFKCPA